MNRDMHKKMVTSIGNPKSSQKDSDERRIDWIVRFPAWAQEYCELSGRTPLRMMGDVLIAYHPDFEIYPFHIVHDTKNGYQAHHSLSCAYGFAGGHQDFLYSDGNVPLWGDVVVHINGLGFQRKLVGFNCDGSVALDNSFSLNAEPKNYRLLRRHSFIADLPKITEGNVENKKETVVDLPKIIEEHVDDEVKDSIVNDTQKSSKLRVGMLVIHDEMGRGVIAEPVSEAVLRVLVRFFDSGRVEWIYKSHLTPIPPPLIDNGDGTWTLEGYDILKIRLDEYTKKWHYGTLNRAVYSLPFDTPTAAAEDLWRRMERMR